MLKVAGTFVGTLLRWALLFCQSRRSFWQQSFFGFKSSEDEGTKRDFGFDFSVLQAARLRWKASWWNTRRDLSCNSAFLCGKKISLKIRFFVGWPVSDCPLVKNRTFDFRFQEKYKEEFAQKLKLHFWYFLGFDQFGNHLRYIHVWIWKKNKTTIYLIFLLRKEKLTMEQENL